MARQPSRNLYLYLALACFLGIVLIFFFDGYVGVYDSLTANNGAYQQEVTAEQWQNPGRYGPEFNLSLDEAGFLVCTYRVDNRRFTSLSDAVRVTVNDTAGRTSEVLINTIKAGAFGHGEVRWTLNGADYIPPSVNATSIYDIHLVIERGEVRREVAIYLTRNSGVPKAIPAPVE